MPWPIQAFRTLSETIIGMPNACEIQRFVEGEDDEGRPVEVWSTIENTRCRLIAISGTEVAEAGRLAPTSNLTAFLPFGTDLTHQDRLKIGDEYFEVEYVLEGSPEFQAHVKAFVTSQRFSDQ